MVWRRDCSVWSSQSHNADAQSLAYEGLEGLTGSTGANSPDKKQLPHIPQSPVTANRKQAMKLENVTQSPLVVDTLSN